MYNLYCITIGEPNESPEYSPSDLSLSTVYSTYSVALFLVGLRSPVRRFIVSEFRLSVVSRNRCRSTMSLYVITLSPLTIVEWIEARDIFSLFCFINHWFLTDKTVQWTNVFWKLLMIFCSRCILLVFVDVKSYSIFIRINVKVLNVIRIRKTFLTKKLINTLRIVDILETVNILVKECLISRNIRLELKKNKSVLRHIDLMFSSIKVVIRTRSYRRIKYCFLTMFISLRNNCSTCLR